MYPAHIEIVLACDPTGAIGVSETNSMPWPRSKADMEHFAKVTANGTLVMGRKTAESIGRTLDGRRTVVVSGSMGIHYSFTDVGRKVCHRSVPSLQEAVEKESGPLFMVGGAALLKEAMSDPRMLGFVRRLHLTRVAAEYPEADVRVDLERLLALFPVVIDGAAAERRLADGLGTVETRAPYRGTCSLADDAYENLVRTVLAEGELLPNRTGTDALTVHGHMMRFSMAGGRFPLLTTKRVAWKQVVGELLWFLSGSTDAAELSREYGTKIWDANAAAFFERGAAAAPGDLGPVYGFQWRHFGATYDFEDLKTMSVSEYNLLHGGADQIRRIIDQLRDSPDSRQIVLSAWNAKDVPDMALPPCHALCHFRVFGGRLSATMFQRSADVGLGVPFNIASYALLVHVLARAADLEPGELCITTSDTHIYQDHVGPLKEQIEREPMEPPTLTVRAFNDIDDLTADHIFLRGYNAHPPVKMKMAV